MKILAERVKLDCSATYLWSILSDVGRCDWVPTIKKITLDGDCRLFEMEGMGTITEKILLKDNEKYDFAIFSHRDSSTNRASFSNYENNS